MDHLGQKLDDLNTARYQTGGLGRTILQLYYVGGRTPPSAFAKTQIGMVRVGLK